MKAHLSPRDLALTLAVVAVLGYTFVPIKVALTEVPPFTLAAMRFLLESSGLDGNVKKRIEQALRQIG